MRASSWWLRFLALGTICLAAFASAASPAIGARSAVVATPAPAFTPAQLTATPDTNWITTGGNAYNQRYSDLTQINTSNVSGLKVAFETHLDGSGKGSKYSAEGTALEYNGVLYVITGNDDVFAIDATTGQRLWTHLSGLNPAISTACCGFDARGVALGQGLIYVAQLDGSIVALDQMMGNVVWSALNATWKDGYTETVSPAYYNGMVFVGVSGGEYGCRCSETAYDASTGKRLWRFFTVPEPGEIGGATWPANSEWQTGGAPTWNNPTFDPSTNTLVFTTGNADAYSGRGPGDDLFTSSFVALDINTGQLKWWYQMVHHDIWDYDCPSPTVMFDVTIKGVLRHGVADACKTGWNYEIDRTTGQPLIGIKEEKVPQSEPQHTAATQPVPAGQAYSPQCARKEDFKGKAPDGKPYKVGCIFAPYWTSQYVASSPGYNGGDDWPPMSYNPGLHAFYVCSSSTATAYEAIPIAHAQPYVGGLGYYNVNIGPNKFGIIAWGGTFTALDATTNRIIWQQKWNGATNYCYSGSFTTAGNLVFVGHNDGTYEADNAASGKRLWSMKLQYGANAPGITYTVNGKQYVALLDGGTTGDGTTPSKRGDAVYVFALP
jgi:PQQ-dependent dehydrogenase (methanol/ethanol family)